MRREELTVRGRGDAVEPAAADKRRTMDLTQAIGGVVMTAGLDLEMHAPGRLLGGVPEPECVADHLDHVGVRLAPRLVPACVETLHPRGEGLLRRQGDQVLQRVGRTAGTTR